MNLRPLRKLRQRALLLPSATGRVGRMLGLQRLDTRPVPEAPHEIRAVIAARNERDRLAGLLRHHRPLGIERFFVIDNGSSDGSREFLLAQPDVHVFHTDAPFSHAANGAAWRSRILETFCRGHWCLNIDADEWLVWPGMEQVPLRDFLAHVEATGARAITGIMIDMYGGGPIAETEWPDDDDMLAACPWYDPGPYRRQLHPNPKAWPRVRVNGGPRMRAFWDGNSSPNLQKAPLLHWQAGDRVLHPHSISPMPLARDEVALLHFKYFADFHRRAQEILEHGQHFLGGREYARYLQHLEQRPGMSLHDTCSARFRDTAQLVAHDLIRITPAYADLWRRRAAQHAAA